ncbi:hypothetical protein [Ideonella sp.]|uniref:hypothetical protein n=1 Tax=Ideonella sp. TaxID=1929293 RepID=UPI003BB78040
MRTDLFALRPGNTARLDLRQARYLSLFERVNTLEGWRTAGIEVPLSRPGLLRSDAARTDYRFEVIRDPSSGEVEAFRTGKRFASHFFVLLSYVQAGVPFEEFTTHPQHWRDYCEGVLAHSSGRLDDAHASLVAALQSAPEEVRYLELWFKVRFDLTDDSAAEEAIKVFADDMDAYAEQMMLWLKLLLKRRLYGRAAVIAVRTDVLLAELAAGKRKHRYYGHQSVGFYAHQHDKFRKQLEHWINSSRYRPLATEIEKLGGLRRPAEPQNHPSAHAEPCASGVAQQLGTTIGRMVGGWMKR